MLERLTSPRNQGAKNRAREEGLPIMANGLLQSEARVTQRRGRSRDRQLIRAAAIDKDFAAFLRKILELEGRIQLSTGSLMRNATKTVTFACERRQLPP